MNFSKNLRKDKIEKIFCLLEQCKICSNNSTRIAKNIAHDNSKFLILCIMYMCRRQFNSQSFCDITFVILQFSFIFFLAPKLLVIHFCLMLFMLFVIKMRTFSQTPHHKKEIIFLSFFSPTTFSSHILM